MRKRGNVLVGTQTASTLSFCVKTEQVVFFVVREQYRAGVDNSFSFYRLALVGASDGFVGTPKLDTSVKYG